MISITIIPELFRLARLKVGDLSIEFDEIANKLILRGVTYSTDDLAAELNEKPTLNAEFIDADGHLLCAGTSELHGYYFEFGFCAFSVEIANISTIMDVNDIAEIRLKPSG